MTTNEEIMNFLLSLEKRIKRIESDVSSIETDVRRIKHKV